VPEGEFHEALNLASIWKLPVLFICENNQYSMGMAVEKAWAVDSLMPRAAAHNIPGEQVDGMDVISVYETTRRAVDYIRGGKGPYLLEIKTYRFRGHSMTDPAYYRTREEEQSEKYTAIVKNLLENDYCESCVDVVMKYAANNLWKD